MEISRRAFLGSAGALALGGCQTAVKAPEFKWIDLVHLGMKMWGDLPRKPERMGIQTKILTDEEYAAVTAPETAESGEQAENADSAAAPESGKTKENKNNTRSGKKGKADGTEAAPRITFELLLEKGVISREVYDAIMDFIRNYTAENAPAAPALPAEAEGAGT